MRIGQATFSILKNFSTINDSILIKPGNVLATVDAGTSPSIRAIATVEEEFPARVAIYDLHKFLGTINMMGNCDIEFEEKKAIFASGKSKVEYIYTGANLVKEVSTKRPKGGEMMTFDLSEKDISTVAKAATVFAATAISFVSVNGDASINVGTPRSDMFDSLADTFRLDLGKTEKDFDIRIPVENFKVLPKNYTVTLNEDKFIYLSATDISLEYWIAATPDSES